jgi:ribulose-5-phosphate 4-epimerase/fuculose-1-phosphate aldolase
MKNTSETEARQDLAAAHRLAVFHGLNEGVWNHISMVSPDDPDHMLITPGHMHWSQVTASNLALMDGKGNLLSGEREPIRAGWIIHRPVHRALPNAICAIHVHAPYITAMSIRNDIRLETRSSQQAAQFHNDVAYYEEYDGVLEAEEEGERMVEALGNKRVLMLRNHGAMVAGHSVGQAYLDVYQLERACMYQMLAMSGGGKMQLIPEDVAIESSRQARAAVDHGHWGGLKRWVEAKEPDFAN